MRQSQLSLKARAFKLLAMREHSRLELERKLSAHEKEAGELVTVLDALQTRGFISDERVADSVLHQKAHRFGLHRVKAELQAKGLKPEVVQSALDSLRETEWQRAYAVWQKKFGVVAHTPQEQAKQMRFLAARGFTAEVVRRTVSGVHDVEEHRES